MQHPPLPRGSLVKIPRQQRAVVMVHAILDAGIELLEREGIEPFTTNRVAARAGVSVGSLYQYFANKEMIIAGIVERGVLDTEHLIRAAVQSGASVAAPDVLKNLLLALLLKLEPYRALLAEILAGTPLLAGRGIATVLETRLSDALRDFLVANADRYVLVGGPAMMYSLVNGAIYVVLRWLSEPPAFVSREQLVDVLALQLVAALRAPPGAAEVVGSAATEG